MSPEGVRDYDSIGPFEPKELLHISWEYLPEYLFFWDLLITEIALKVIFGEPMFSLRPSLVWGHGNNQPIMCMAVTRRKNRRYNCNYASIVQLNLKAGWRFSPEPLQPW